ncbi:tRNA (guanosine(37)-N1)-methyltransferase TrmD, partial [bacterium]|nr:tRNA (guanosine(37)-N1)-methyltransferase TrmD [bacterium]
MLTFHIITLFSEAFSPYTSRSILGRAVREGKIAIKFYNPRDFVKPGETNRRTIDGRPYGGGPGMVMLASPVLKAVMKAQKNTTGRKIILFSPGGKQFTNMYAKALAKKYADIVLIAGRYEGIDARVKKILRAEEISIGPFIVTGGELPAMVLMDAVSRQIGGV